MMKTLRIGFIVGAGLLWLCGSPAGAAIVQFAATLNGAQETPPNGSAGSGSGALTMDTDANTLIGSATFSGLGSAETMAHIHGFSAIGVPSGIIFNLALGSPKAVNWNFAEGQQANIIAGLTYFNVHTTGFPGGEIRGQIVRVPSCGDGILDGGETCDDGNVVGGDCCSAACLVEASGDPCASDGDPCTLDECDGAGNCGVGAPRTGCLTATKTALTMKDQPIGTKDKLIWKWLKGPEIALAELGVPTGTTAYTLCIFTGPTSAPKGSADVPPGAAWAASGDTGFKYKATDPDALPDGVGKVILKSGAAGKTKALVKGKGTALPDLLALPLDLPVTVQLVNDATPLCLEGEYDLPDVKSNADGVFKAKAQ